MPEHGTTPRVYASGGEDPIRSLASRRQSLPKGEWGFVDAIRADELFFLLEQLRGRGDIEWPLLEEPEGGVRQIPVTRQSLTRARLTAQGWQRAQIEDREGVTVTCLPSRFLIPRVVKTQMTLSTDQLEYMRTEPHTTLCARLRELAKP